MRRRLCQLRSTKPDAGRPPTPFTSLSRRSRSARRVFILHGYGTTCHSSTAQRHGRWSLRFGSGVVASNTVDRNQPEGTMQRPVPSRSRHNGLGVQSETAYPAPPPGVKPHIRFPIFDHAGHGVVLGPAGPSRGCEVTSLPRGPRVEVLPDPVAPVPWPIASRHRRPRRGRRARVRSASPAACSAPPRLSGRGRCPGNP